MKIRSFINQHYEKARQRGYIAYFAEAAKQFDFPTELLMAIASRETNMSNIKGDFRDGIYHGYGIMQVDIGTAPDWVRSGKWQDVRESILKGTSVLAEKARQLKREWPKDHPRTLQTFFWVLAASYNQGASIKGGALGDYLKYGNPDKTTTGHDYGRDVLSRMAEFGSLLAPEALTASQPAGSVRSDQKSQPEGQPEATGSLSVVDASEGQPEATEWPQMPDLASSGSPVPDSQPEGQYVPSGSVSEAPASLDTSNDPPVVIPPARVAKSGALKALWAALLAPLFAGGIDMVALVNAARSIPPFVWPVLAVSILVTGAVAWKFLDRQTKLDVQREAHAHEIDKLHAAIASDKNKIDVMVLPPQN